MTAPASFLDVLDLEQLDRDLFRAPLSGSGDGWHLFGGEVCAQALLAAYRTVDADRMPHSLHGYFLRRGTPQRRVVLRVERDRDGGSFSARRVVALQDGEVIFSLAASFHLHEESGEYQVAAPVDVDPPEAVEDSPFPGGPATHFDGRILAAGTAHGGVVPRRLWMRARGDLGADPIVHACALAYVSDYGSGFAGVEVPDLSQAGGSLDHVLWFHSPLRLDGWVLLDTWPLRASGARGTYMGAVHDQAGVLGAVFAQEALLRVRPPGDLPPIPGMTRAS